MDEKEKGVLFTGLLTSLEDNLRSEIYDLKLENTYFKGVILALGKKDVLEEYTNSVLLNKYRLVKEE